MAVKTNTEIVDYSAPMKSISAERDIVLLQADDYRGLFSIGTDNKLYAYHEQSGVDVRFVRTEVYPDCKHFAAVRMDDTECFAMALISGEKVYTCVTEEPWKVGAGSFSELDFSGVLGGRSLTPTELFVNQSGREVTIAIMMKDDTGRIEQFVANFSTKNPVSYSYHALACNFSYVTSMVCGRAYKQPVDGVYTFGMYGQSSQLIYTPVENIFGEEPPDSVRLGVPETGLNCITKCYLDNDAGTHLFAVGGSTLYMYPYEKQLDCMHVPYSNYDKIAESEYFCDAKKLVSYMDKASGKLYVWILNESGKLSYTFAKIMEDGKCGGFVTPVSYGENVLFFDASPASLVICKSKEILFGTRNPEGGYTFDCVSIKSDTGESVVFKAFATKIVTDKPLGEIRLVSKVPVEAYVNNTFYRFTDVIVKADGNGVVDVVQNASDISAIPFFISMVEDGTDANEDIEFYAGRVVHDKVMSLNTAQKLKTARIMDLHGDETRLAEGLTEEQLKLAADTIAELALNCNILMKSNGSAYYFKKSIEHQEDGLVDDIGYYLGEAWDYICNQAERFWNKTLGKAISFISRIVSGVIHFVIKIGEEVITIVLDSAGKVLKCMVRVLEFIGIPVDKILDWLMAFLDIDGAVRMKNAMKLCAEFGFKELRNNSAYSKEYLKEKLDEVIETVEKWADFDAGTVKPVEQRMFSFDMNTANMYLFDHIFKQGNFMSITLPVTEPPNEVKSHIDKLKGILVKYDFEDVDTELFALLENIDIVTTDISGFTDLIKRILGLFAIEVLSAAKETAEILFQLEMALLDWIWEVLNTNIHIPFISAVFEFFGIEEFSLLDVICIVPAFGYNLIYRAVKGKSVVNDEELAALQVLLADGGIGYQNWMNGIFENVISQENEEWDGENYNPKAMSELELPKGIKYAGAMVFMSIIAAGNLFGTIFACYNIVTESRDDKAITGDCIGLALTGVMFGASYAYGYHCYGPMNYNSDYPNAAFNRLWFVKTGLSGCIGLVSIVTKKNEANKKLLNTLKGCMVFSNLLSFVLEAWAADNANKLNLSKEKIMYKGEMYTLNPKVLDVDRKIFLANTIGYCFDDFNEMIEVLLDLFDTSKLPPQVKIVLCIARGITGLCSTGANVTSMVLLGDA